jgi:putative endopeptidase
MPATATEEPRVPRFSIQYMDRSADPATRFYDYATGTWRRENPTPADKAVWGAGAELLDRNYRLIRQILESAAADSTAPVSSPRRQVGDLYASALAIERREALGLDPVRPLLDRIGQATASSDLIPLLAELHDAGVYGIFQPFAYPDRNRSTVYAFYVYQGGLSLPDREYYLADSFAAQREAFRSHVGRVFRLAGVSDTEADAAATTVLEIETELARVSRSATDLRDDTKNHHPCPVDELATRFPGIAWDKYLATRRADVAGYVVVGQPEFFEAVGAPLSQRPVGEWQVYLRWQVLHDNAPYLSKAFEEANFEFFHHSLQGQAEPEPDWKRAALTVDQQLGEALGRLYVERHFPPEARARMVDLVADVCAVFRDRLNRVDWMTAPTRQKALAKFDRFTAKIGHPDRYRDYSPVVIRRDEYAASRQRAVAFEIRRQMDRIGKPVDRTEWEMTPPTVNAYFSPTQNEIVFPAGILQPPFFDVTMDDAVNYGAIGAVIGHEITHGYDDQGRRFDADGNLVDWWGEADAREFEARAKQVVDEYNRLEALPGVFVNGELTLGENIADGGGVSLAYEALQRRLARDGASRTRIDGLTPEQRFFVSWAQVWRQNCREAERRRRLTMDPHSPGEFRAVAPLTALPEFAEAFPAHEPSSAACAGPRRDRIW